MRVYAPRQVGIYATNQYDYILKEYVDVIIPFTGDWVDVDDYFVQRTSGNDINDVIHAKVVSPGGVSISVGECRNAKTGRRAVPLHVRYYSRSWSATYAIANRFRGPGLVLISLSRSWYYVTVGFQFLTKSWLPTMRRQDKTGSKTWRQLCGYSGFSMSVDSSGTYRITSPSGVAHHYYPMAQGLMDWLKSFGKPSWPFSEELALDVITGCCNWVQANWDDICWFTKVGNSDFADVTGTPWYPISDDYYPDLNITRPDSSVFLLDEADVIGNNLDPVLLGKDTDFSGYWRNWLTQHALLEACESLPRLNENSISNIIELVGFIKALVIDHKIEIPDSLQSAWLSYRYAYSTTKLDAEEAIEFVHRHMDLGGLDRRISCYGVSHTNYEGCDITCRCRIDVIPRNLDNLGRIWRALYTYGLQPNFYVVWDMIPYSFIVDWFIPVGDILSTLDADRMYLSGEYYDFENVCYSLSYVRELDDNTNVKCYTRWKGSVPSCFNSFYWFDEPEPSRKTVGYRVLDALSLFVH